MAEVKAEIKQAIAAAAEAAARAAVKEATEEAAKADALRCETNHFRAMESLLWNYNKLRERVEDVDAYMETDIRGRSGSITTAPPKGASYQDSDDVFDAIQKQKAIAYAQTRARFEEIEGVVRQFEGRREFVVVRMYYFAQNYDGSPRTGERWTWEELTDALEEQGILQNVKTARRWRSQIVADMAVCMFGAAAAITTQTRREQRTTGA